MSSQKKSTPPPPSALTPAGWDESAAFRETTLRHFTEPGDSDVLRRFGVMLHDMALELARIWTILPGSDTAAHLRAAAADLRHVQGHLALASHDRNVSSLTPGDEDLALLAERLAAEVGQIAETLERAAG
jgi:hypothetical protein